jgi:hypothetical protein
MLEDCALAVFSIILWWLGGFFGALAVFLLCFGGWVVFSAVLWWFFSAFDDACFAVNDFVCFFLEVIQEGCHYRDWSS